MKNYKIIDNNLTEQTSIIDMDSEIHREVMEIFAEEQEKVYHTAQRSKCNFYVLQQQESGENYE